MNLRCFLKADGITEDGKESQAGEAPHHQILEITLTYCIAQQTLLNIL